MKLANLPAWRALKKHQLALSHQTLADLFADEPNRAQLLSKERLGFRLDFAKQHLVPETVKLWAELASSCHLDAQLAAWFEGERVNISENRSAQHMSLRAEPPPAEVTAVLEQMDALVTKFQAGHVPGLGTVTDIICLGIGGSHLGPALGIQALRAYHQASPRVHFVSNSDGQSLTTLLGQLVAKQTCCFISSKTFTTLETLSNATLVRAWFAASDRPTSLARLFAITARPDKACAWGILKQQVLPLWEWVGGRFSIWSAVGLPLALKIGMPAFKAFLAGAADMDQHVTEAPFADNMPKLLAFTDIWNSHFMGYPSQAIIPYADVLQNFPAYLQQLELESNGKRVDQSGHVLTEASSPVLWGGVGCDVQHAFMQALHMGTHIVPVDFICPIKQIDEPVSSRDIRVASCLAQAQALLLGSPSGTPETQFCPGNRPSTTLFMAELDPRQLGRLLALYEHKTIIQAFIWGNNPFDQWGVELGKQKTGEILSLLQQQTALKQVDGSTQALIHYYRSLCGDPK